jgi:CubicO group peptidase (beta-lactamase class C family)
MQLKAAAGLPRATPSAMGVDAAGITRFLDAAQANELELHSFMLLRRGAVVAEGAWAPYALDLPHMQHSATKSWTAAAVGLAVDDGLIRLDDRVLDFFPEHRPATVSANLAAMTVSDLLTMRTGHRTGISGGEWRAIQDSWVRAFLAEPVPDQPGNDFIYGSGASYMLSAIVSKVTGRTIHDLLKERLFRPLGIGPLAWDVSPEGYNTGGNGISCSTEDMARFGQLHLQRGMWNGQYLLSESWVDAATRNQVREAWLGVLDGRRYSSEGVQKKPGYGYQWWMTKDGGYYASGLFGQNCIVLPKLEAVLVFTAALRVGEPRLFDLTWEHLVPAIGAATAPDPTGDTALADRLRALALPDRPAGEPCAALAESISGKRYVVDANEDGVDWVELAFEGERCVFSLQDGRGVHRIEAGLERPIDGRTTMTGNRLHHQYQPETLRVVAQGAWPAPDQFVMRWRFVETAFCDTVVCSFKGDTLRLDRSVNTNTSDLALPTLYGRSG